MQTARPFPASRRTWHTLLAIGVSAGIHCAAHGQSAQPVTEALLGLSEPELQARVPELRRVGRPVSGPRGLRGLWGMSEITQQGVVLDTVIYLRAGTVQRIEQRWASRTPDECRPARLSVLADPIAQRLGPATLAANDAMDASTQQHTTLWAVGAAEARLVLTRTGERCAALIVYAPRVTPDASEL